VAGELHLLSGRRGPLVSVNCATLADGVVQSELFGHVKGAYSGADSARAGLVERARGGTLVLDEIGEASPVLQANLLRLLQEREARAVGSDRVVQVDARFVAATNRDLAPAVRRGSFREDLYSRLNRCVIRVPPLRERREDILPLARHFASQLTGSEVRLASSLALALLRHDWPGNVRSLQGLVERLYLELGDRDPWPVPPWLEEELGQHARFEGQEGEGSLVGPASVSPPEVPRKRTRLEGDELRARLVAHDGNVTLLAEELGVARNTLYRWIRRDGIDLAKLRDSGLARTLHST
jgi:transcriptional regulator with PAS, ATPase and Fis domain